MENVKEHEGRDGKGERMEKEHGERWCIPKKSIILKIDHFTKLT